MIKKKSNIPYVFEKAIALVLLVSLVQAKYFCSQKKKEVNK
jgi:hypothetical protein